jgi:hypothetical protein
MKRSILILLTLSLAAQAQTDRRKSVRAWFADGTGVEIQTEATGPSTTVELTQGVIGISYDRQFRLVTDKNGHALFAYYLDGKASNAPNTEFIRISPIDQDNLPVQSVRGVKLTPPIPTVDTVREFPAVKTGQAVTLEILFNPTTGEKVYEVIRPLTDPSPAVGNGNVVVTGGGEGDQLSLKDITVRVNGQAMEAPLSWMLGGVARIEIPGHGLYFVSVADPKRPFFSINAQVNRQSLSWNTDGVRVEITSKTNILLRSDSQTIWLFHARNYKTGDKISVETADSVDLYMN